MKLNIQLAILGFVTLAFDCTDANLKKGLASQGFDITPDLLEAAQSACYQVLKLKLEHSLPVQTVFPESSDNIEPSLTKFTESASPNREYRTANEMNDSEPQVTVTNTHTLPRRTDDDAVYIESIDDSLAASQPFVTSNDTFDSVDIYIGESQSAALFEDKTGHLNNSPVARTMSQSRGLELSHVGVAVGEAGDRNAVAQTLTGAAAAANDQSQEEADVMVESLLTDTLWDAEKVEDRYFETASPTPVIDLQKDALAKVAHEDHRQDELADRIAEAENHSLSTVMEQQIGIESVSPYSSSETPDDVSSETLDSAMKSSEDASEIEDASIVVDTMNLLEFTAPAPPKTRFEELLEMYPELLQYTWPAKSIYKMNVYRPLRVRSESLEGQKRGIPPKIQKGLVRHNIVERSIYGE